MPPGLWVGQGGGLARTLGGALEEDPGGCGGEGGPWHLSVLEIGQFKTWKELFIYAGKRGLGGTQ